MLITKRRLFILLPLFSLFAISCGGQERSYKSNSSSSDGGWSEPIEPGIARDGQLNLKLNEIVSESGRPAIAAFTIYDGEIIELAAEGLRSADDVAEVTERDLWHIGSITKSMTATLAAFLVDDGLITWDTTIGEVFPEWSDQILEQNQAIEFQQLLTHTSGLEDDFSNPVYAEFDPTLSSEEQRLTGGPMALSYDHGRPVNEFHYANVNFILAGTMLEKITGQSWRQLISERMFQPLGIVDFGFGLPGEEGVLDQPTGHTFNGVSAIPGDWVHELVFDPSGLVHISLEGMATYANFHLQGIRGEGSLLSESSYQMLYSPASQVGSGAYAMGWFLSSDGYQMFHDGSNSRWYAYIKIDADLNAAFFVVSNSFSAGLDIARTDTGVTEAFVPTTLEILSSRLENYLEGE